MRFIQGDCIEELPQLKEIDLIITDPPYNIGWQYSKEVKDNMTNYDDWCVKWVNLCFKSLSDNGLICIINYPENNNVLFTALLRFNYNFVQQLIWKYPTNIGHSKRKYTRTYRTILIFSKNKEYYFNPIKQPYKNKKDKRIKKLIAQGSTGTNHYDVFTFNLCKNISKMKKNVGLNQLPDSLIEMLIHSFSKKGDVILDPFVGNGTVMIVADRLGRKGIGIDINIYKNLNEVKR